MGRTRVFFRAGQISTLQRILNETSDDKAPWIFRRLEEALANRQKAKAAAAEAQVTSRAQLVDGGRGRVFSFVKRRENAKKRCSKTSPSIQE